MYALKFVFIEKITSIEKTYLHWKIIFIEKITSIEKLLSLKKIVSTKKIFSLKKPLPLKNYLHWKHTSIEKLFSLKRIFGLNLPWMQIEMRSWTYFGWGKSKISDSVICAIASSYLSSIINNTSSSLVTMEPQKNT